MFWGAPEGDIPLTPSETENNLRDEIETYVRRFTVLTGRKPWTMNLIIKAEFGKSRAEMTIPELQRALEYVKKRWPADKIRRRVTRKITLYNR